MNMFNRLTRSHLSFLVAFSSLAGYLLYPAKPNAVQGLLLCVGIWLLAAGGSALNQVQEKDVDARMLRTRKRPLATGYLEYRYRYIDFRSVDYCRIVIRTLASW